MPAVIYFLLITTCLRRQLRHQTVHGIFAYFKDPAKDGLHLAYSMDGYQWTALNNDESFLKPWQGKIKLMRGSMHHSWR
jgi:hypothetical protein